MKNLADFVDSVDKLDLKDGDMLLIRLPRQVSHTNLEDFRDTIKVMFPGRRIITITDDASVDVVRIKEIAEEVRKEILNDVMESFRSNSKGCALQLTALILNRIRKETEHGS